MGAGADFFERTGRRGAVLLALLWLAFPGQLAAGTQDEADPAAVDGPGDRTLLAGTWDYNPALSIDVLTGRPEQGPEGATQRGSAASLPGAGREGRGRGGDADLQLARFSMMREARDLARDLLEVPETLTFDLGDGAVTVTDDLDRSWTYRTDGREERHQIAASEFDARTTWLGNQLRQEISSSAGFDMDQTYFVGADGQQLFVIVRIGEADDDEPQAGYDRVYDRVSE